MWGTIFTSIGVMLGGGLSPHGSTAAAQTAENTSAALDVLRKSISVDVHAHGGTTGITSKAPPSNDLAGGMRAGSLAVACLADVPDGPILGRHPASSPPCARRSRASSTNTISSALPGWTRLWRTMDCAEHSSPPI
jgi:hypothetical protein